MLGFHPTRTRPLLIVDDCRDTTNSLAFLAADQGYEVFVANEGAEALRLAGWHRPAVVLLDLGMPGMDGFEIARRLRALPGLQNVLLVALTGYSMPGHRQRCREEGFALHLIKPVNFNRLWLLLANLEKEDPMNAEQLARLTASLGDAAEVVEAIDRPELQQVRGWNLAGWEYELIPWGVRFTRRSEDGTHSIKVYARGCGFDRRLGAMDGIYEPEA